MFFFQTTVSFCCVFRFSVVYIILIDNVMENSLDKYEENLNFGKTFCPIQLRLRNSKC